MKEEVKSILFSNLFLVRVYARVMRVFFYCSMLISSNRNRRIGERQLDYEGQKILFLVPHFDDEILGGYFFLKNNTTHIVDILYVTDGSNCLSSKFISNVIEVRKRESLAASRNLQVNQINYLDFKDGSLLNNITELESEFIRHLRSGQYDLVLSPSPDDKTPDHRAIALAAGEATNMAGGTLLFYRSTWCTFPIEKANYLYVGNWKEKARALMHFKSQANIPLLNTLLYTKHETGDGGVEGFITSETYFKVRSHFCVSNMLQRYENITG